MRLVACLTLCLMPIIAAAQTDTHAPSGAPAYCVNSSADFYPYTGEPCKSGYQLGSGNCRNTNGRMVAVPREECLAQAGTVEIHFLYDCVLSQRLILGCFSLIKRPIVGCPGPLLRESIIFSPVLLVNPRLEQRGEHVKTNSVSLKTHRRAIAIEIGH